jgi:PhnB protein
MTDHKPSGHNAVSPYLLVASVASQISFLTTTFGAKLTSKWELPGGVVRHAEVRIEDSIVMLGERPDVHWPIRCSVHVYVPNVDVTYANALAAGAVSVSPPRDQEYGDRSAGVRDGEGNVWWLGTRMHTG